MMKMKVADTDVDDVGVIWMRRRLVGLSGDDEDGEDGNALS